MESGDVGKAFEDIIKGSWGEDIGRFEDSSGTPTRGALQLSDGRSCERRPDGSWCESETGSQLPQALSDRLEQIWLEWAPRLPEEVRNAVEDPDGGGGGVREPRRPLPTSPAATAAHPEEDG